jgi:hypothetical protein
MSKRRTEKRRRERQQEQMRLREVKAKPAQGDRDEDTYAGDKAEENFADMQNPTIFDKFFRGKAAAWTAIFTCVLAVFSYLLWEANSDANQTTVATQRASITFGAVYLEKVAASPTDPLTGYRAHIQMTNGGTTPTKYGFYEMSAAVQDSGPDENTDFDALPQSRRLPFIFGPHQLYDSQGAQISLSDLEAVGAGKKHMFLWGWIVYRDTFSGTPIHLSEYCLNVTDPKWMTPTGVISANHSDVNGITAITTLPCPTHYCYESDCGDYSKRIQGFK